jgi:hypothetical protein
MNVKKIGTAWRYQDDHSTLYVIKTHRTYARWAVAHRVNDQWVTLGTFHRLKDAKADAYALLANN